MRLLATVVMNVASHGYLCLVSRLNLVVEI